MIYQVEGGEGEEGEAALPRLDTHFFRHTRSSGRSRSFANTREVAARSVQYSTVQYSTRGRWRPGQDAAAVIMSVICNICVQVQAESWPLRRHTIHLQTRGSRTISAEDIYGEK